MATVGRHVTARQSALDQFDDMDRQLRAHVAASVSLCPDRDRPTSLRGIGEALLTDRHDAAVVRAFADEFRRIVETKFDEFPGSIFCDMDYLAASLIARDDVYAIRQTGMRVAELYRGYGRSSVIHFRYDHDFIYGYDWATWVRDDPTVRRRVAPFDDEFLYYLQEHRGELIGRIAARDKKYSWVPDGTHRNTFSFSREPADEHRLHETLARFDRIPVQAWSFDGPIAWKWPFRQIRDQYASLLGIPARPPGA